jgi:glycosyltransferase involved in cell wall biosynthesis
MAAPRRFGQRSSSALQGGCRLWHEGYEVVYGIRQDRASDTWFKRTSASAFYRLLRRLTDVDIPGEVGDFRLVDRRALDAFKEMDEGSRFVRGMFSWMGFRQIGVPYARAPRHARCERLLRRVPLGDQYVVAGSPGMEPG